ncbi:MAG: ROK family protein [Tannerella sp.]|jgi:glucokinase|nr:ROK family protein [Tannerella sp.]
MVIGIDIGGTKINGAVFDEDGDMFHHVSHLLEGRTGKNVGSLICQIIDELMDSRKVENIEAIGVCVPGIANVRTRKVWAPNIEGWENYPLQDEIEKHINRLSITVEIASDRTCYILGEKWRGNAIGCNNAAFIAVGTGIGIGLLVDGQVLHGHGDIVGAAGWLALEPDYQEEFKSYGCFESQASGAGIVLQTKKLLKTGKIFPKSLLYQKNIDFINTYDVFEAYNQNDELAKQVIHKAVKMWGMAAANIVSLLNPEKIIWGGGVFGPAVRLINDIYTEALRWAQPISIKQVKFEKSELGGDAGLYGAGYLALKSPE